MAEEYWPIGDRGKIAAFILLSIMLLIHLKRRYFNFTLNVNRKFFVQLYSVRLFEEIFEVEGFIDSGNECTEVISQLPVHFIHIDCLKDEKFTSLKSALNEWEQNQTVDYSTFEKFGLTRIRFVFVNSLFSDNKLSLAFKGDIIYQNQTHPCYFIFVNSEQLFPENAHLLLHASFLTNIMEEVNS